MCSSPHINSRENLARSHRIGIKIRGRSRAAVRHHRAQFPHRLSKQTPAARRYCSIGGSALKALPIFASMTSAPWLRAPLSAVATSVSWKRPECRTFSTSTTCRLPKRVSPYMRKALLACRLRAADASCRHSILHQTILSFSGSTPPARSGSS